MIDKYEKIITCLVIIKGKTILFKQSFKCLSNTVQLHFPGKLYGRQNSRKSIKILLQFLEPLVKFENQCTC